MILLGGCTTHTGSYTYEPKASQKYPSDKLAMTSSSIYKKNGDLCPTMRPYTVMGKEYCPTVVRVGDVFGGVASWYGDDFHGKQTSSGEAYDMYAMTAAHKTLPMNTVVRVTNTQTNAQTIVRINDRGPFVETRIIDLSYAAAQQIGVDKSGTAPVTLEVLGFEPGSARTIDMVRVLHRDRKNRSSIRFTFRSDRLNDTKGLCIRRKNTQATTAIAQLSKIQSIITNDYFAYGLEVSEVKPKHAILYLGAISKALLL